MPEMPARYGALSFVDRLSIVDNSSVVACEVGHPFVVFVRVALS